MAFEVSSEFAKKERQYTAQGNIAQFLYVFADWGRSCAAMETFRSDGKLCSRLGKVMRSNGNISQLWSAMTARIMKSDMQLRKYI